MPLTSFKRSAVLTAAMLSLLPAFAHGSSRPDRFEVVSTVPRETAISRAGTRAASSVWLEMIQAARASVELAEFYLSAKEGEALEPLIEAILSAGRRGVRVRILCEKAMSGIYPETLSRFTGCRGITVRLFDWKPLTGGVLHAKYFIVDDRDVFIGSQNFDWRSLSHIQETGLRIRDPLFAKALQSIFEADWQYSSGDKAAYRDMAAKPALRFSADAYLVSSPGQFNPPGVGAALEALVALIGSARSRITVQLLTYSLENGERGEKFTRIDQALRRAAQRGVQVHMLVSNWNLRRPQVDGLRGLARVPNIEVKFATIPEAAHGFIPYARVVHSKVMRVDEDISWVGTSNWGYDYFFQSRNVEIVLHRPEVARVLDEIFLSLWNGPYAQRLDPEKEYTPPRIK